MKEHEAPRAFLSGLLEALCWGSLIVGCMILAAIRIGLFK
jgi:hypothetical protein